MAHPISPLVGIPSQEGPEPPPNWQPPVVDPTDPLAGLNYTKFAPGGEGFPGPDMSGMESLIGTLMGQMEGGIPGGGAPMQDVPQGPGSLNSMAAVFASTMAGPQQQETTARQLAAHKQNQRIVEKENRRTEAENFRQEQSFQIDKLREINQVEFKIAEEMLDYQKMQKILKDDMRLAAVKHKFRMEEDKALEDLRMDRAKVSTGEEQEKKASPAAQSAAQKRARSSDVEFWESADIYSVEGKPGWWGDKEHSGPMLPEFFPHARELARAQITNSAMEIEKTVGLTRYLSTLHEYRDDEGHIDMDAPEVDRWINWVIEHKGEEDGRKYLKQEGVI